MTNRWHEIPPERNVCPAISGAVPTLRTDRLVLRAPRLDDVPVRHDINLTVADVSMRTTGRDGTWNDLMQMTATWILRGHGWWTIDNAKGACGFVGLGFEPGDHEPELGYLLSATARGKGYATEAAQAARDFARNTAQLHSLVSYISDSNTASQNVASKLGAARDPEAEAALGKDHAQVWRHWKGGA